MNTFQVIGEFSQLKEITGFSGSEPMGNITLRVHNFADDEEVYFRARLGRPLYKIVKGVGIELHTKMVIFLAGHFAKLVVESTSGTVETFPLVDQFRLLAPANWAAKFEPHLNAYDAQQFRAGVMLSNAQERSERFRVELMDVKRAHAATTGAVATLERQVAAEQAAREQLEKDLKYERIINGTVASS